MYILNLYQPYLNSRVKVLRSHVRTDRTFPPPLLNTKRESVLRTNLACSWNKHQDQGLLSRPFLCGQLCEIHGNDSRTQLRRNPIFCFLEVDCNISVIPIKLLSPLLRNLLQFGILFQESGFLLFVACPDHVTVKCWGSPHSYYFAIFTNRTWAWSTRTLTRY